MIKIRVEYVLDKNVEDVFDAITDHENYKRFPGFDSSQLLETGKTEKNGKGALRLLVSAVSPSRNALPASKDRRR